MQGVSRTILAKRGGEVIQYKERSQKRNRRRCNNLPWKLAFPLRMSLVRADQRRLPRPRGAWTELIHFKPIEHHIRNRAQSRLCDGKPASDADISSEDWSALRDARRDATLCPECQDKVPSHVVCPELYGMGRHTTAYLYAVPVLAAFDAIRNCSHCRRNTDDDCKAWREAVVVVVTQEARRLGALCRLRAR